MPLSDIFTETDSPSRSVDTQAGVGRIRMKLTDSLRLYKRSRSTPPRMRISCPPTLAYLPYQLTGVQFALQHEGTLLADEMGLGKTLQAIGLINADPSIRKALVVCPAGMRIPWSRELSKWLVRPFRIEVVGIGIAADLGLSVRED